MRGNEKVIEQLNLALCAELTAIAQYMVQAEICENWGYGRLAGLTKARAIQEMKHAETLIERIVFLDGVPNVAVPLTPEIGANVTAATGSRPGVEAGAIREYNDASAICREAGDAGTKDLFDRLIHDEEGHADFLEAQLHAIQEMGIGPYLAQQLGS